jgi:hypothetical protein
MIRVKATREGLIGKKTAVGYFIQNDSWFAALPSHAALWRIVELWADRLEWRGLSPEDVWKDILARSIFPLTAPVLEVGPWNTHDDEYVLCGSRPLSESGVSVSGHGTNHAGIDLSDFLYRQLNVDAHGGYVWWNFVENVSLHT